jgi:hypothetical protein
MENGQMDGDEISSKILVMRRLHFVLPIAIGLPLLILPGAFKLIGILVIVVGLASVVWLFSFVLKRSRYFRVLLLAGSYWNVLVGSVGTITCGGLVLYQLKRSMRYGHLYAGMAVDLAACFLGLLSALFLCYLAVRTIRLLKHKDVEADFGIVP